MSVERARELMARARAGEFANETARREAFATILPDLIGFSGALDFAGGAESYHQQTEGGRLFIDTLFGNVIFEFESSIEGAQGQHAIHQLEEYSTQRLAERSEHVIAVSSDVLRWEIFDVDANDDGEAVLSPATNGRIDLSVGELTDQRLTSWIRFIQRLIGGQLRAWTSQAVLSSFGPDSVLYTDIHPLLTNIVEDALGDDGTSHRLNGLVELLAFDADHQHGGEIITNHLYIQLLIRVLLCNTLEGGVAQFDVAQILNSNDLNEQFNADVVFQEDGYFSWIGAEQWQDRFDEALQSMRETVLNFENVRCSLVLPLLYDTLMDGEVKRWFGQFRTPLELVDRIIRELLPNGGVLPEGVGLAEIENLLENTRLLDPACGTGSFVLASARVLCREVGLDFTHISNQVHGIDIDPTAVLISRACWVEEFGDEIQNSVERMRIPFFIGDAVFGREVEFGDQQVIIGIRETSVNTLTGNLPWAALNSMPEVPYREHLDQCATRLGVRETGSRAIHQNISTTFALEAARLYLEAGGTFGLVLPRDTINGRAHERFRRCSFRDAESPVEFNVTRILDLRNEVFDTLQGAVWFGRVHEGSRRLPGHSLRAAEWPAQFTEDGPRQLRYVSINDTQRSLTSALLYDDQPAETPEENQYMFRQGADVLPLPCFAVDVTAENEQVARIRTSTYARHNSDVKVHRDTDLSGRVEPSLLFRFDTSIHTIPFAQRHQVTNLSPMLAAAPILLVNGRYRTLTDAEMEGFQHGRQWFQRVENGTGRDLRLSITVRNKLASYGNPSGRYVVAYPMTGQNTVAMLIDTEVEDRLYLRHQSFYSVCVDNLDEANYLLGLLNSDVLNVFIRPFQSQGGGEAFEGRHIHTLARLFIPQYDADNVNHVNLANHAAQMRQRVLNDLPDDLVARIGTPGNERAFSGSRIKAERGRVRRALAEEFATLNRLARQALGIPVEPLIGEED